MPSTLYRVCSSNFGRHPIGMKFNTTKKPVDILASHIADRFDDPTGPEARTFAKRFIHENVCGSTAREQACEWALVDVTLERAAWFREND